MTLNQHGDDDLVERLQAEFLQPVPEYLRDSHLGRIQEATADQASQRRNRYRASLAVAAAAVVALGLQLSASVLEGPGETVEPAAGEVAGSPGSADEQASGQADDDNRDDASRQLIGRPASALDGGIDPDGERSVSVLDMATMAEGKSEASGGQAPATELGAPESDIDQSEDEGEGTDDATSDQEGADAGGDSDISLSNQEQPGQSEQSTNPDLTPSTIPTPVHGPTTSITLLTELENCEANDRPGNGNSNRVRDQNPSVNAADQDDCDDRSENSQGKGPAANSER